MSTMSQPPASASSRVLGHPSIEVQRDQVLQADPTLTSRASQNWEEVADLLDELVEGYDELLGQDGEGEHRTRAQSELMRIMSCFDVASATARHNAEVLDDIAAEITIAQARMTTIWAEYTGDRPQQLSLIRDNNDRQFSARSAREVWYPIDGDLDRSARQLSVVPASGTGPDLQDAEVIPLSRP